MKKILLFSTILLFSVDLLGQLHGDGSLTNPYNGTLNGNTTLLTGEIYVNGDIITDHYTLTILPGTTLKIYDGKNIFVPIGGNISAVGNEIEKITFTAYQNNWGHLYLSQSQGSFNYCTFEKGKAVTATPEELSRGGALYANVSSVHIANCLFLDNEGIHGGAIGVNNSNAEILNCTFKNNTALRGSAIYFDGIDLTLTRIIDRCKIFSNNSTERTGAAIHFVTNASATIQNSLIYNNICTGEIGGGVSWAGNGAGIILLNIINSVIANNSPNDVIFRNAMRVSVQNSILWGSDKSVSYGWDESPLSYNLVNCAVQGTYSNLGEIDISTSFTNSFKLNSANTASDGPNFTDLVTYDYRVKFISPCRDKGTSTGAPATDILGHNRIGEFDIGAYEVQYSRWLGTTNNLWATATNWDASIDPSSGTGDIILPSGFIRYPIGSEYQDFTIGTSNQMIIEPGAQVTFDNLTNNGTLIIESSGVSSSGSLIVKGSSTGTGTVTYNRFLRPNDNYGDRHFFSSPVENQGVQAFITANPGKISPYGTGSGIWEWDEETLTANWQIVSPSGSFERGRGYNIDQATGSNGLLKFTGTIVNSATFMATSPYADYNGNPRNTAADYGDPAFNPSPSIWAPGRSWTNYGGGGWNLMGNPFMSAMNAATFISANAGKFDPNYQALYVYDGTSNGGQYKYAAEKIPGPIYAEGGFFSENIQVGQGFFVLALHNDVTFNFTSDMQEHNPSVELLKSANTAANPWPGLLLKVSIDKSESVTTVVFNEEMTVGLDPGYDVGQMSFGSEVEVYTSLLTENGVKFTRQALPITGADNNIIPIGLNAENGGQATFSANVVPLKSGRFLLEDRKTGILTDLGKNTYSVTIPANSFGTGRFYLRISLSNRRTLLSKPEYPNKQDIIIWTLNHKLIIKGLVSNKAIVTVYDTQGKKICESKLVDEMYNTIDLPLYVRGVYLVKVSDSEVYSKKVVIL